MGKAGNLVCEVCGRTNKETRVFNSIKFNKILCNKHWKQMDQHGEIISRTRYDPNKYYLYSSYAEIELYSVYGEVTGKTKIDLDDVALCKKYKITLSRTTGYAVFTLNKKTERLHRLLMGIPKNKDIDHINHNILDNRKSNLRSCSTAQNTRNSVKTSSPTSSIYKGVHFASHAKKWRAVIVVNYKAKHLGYFKIEREAALAYNIAAKKYHKGFALLNNIEDNNE